MIDFEFLAIASLEYERAIDWYRGKSNRAASSFVTELNLPSNQSASIPNATQNGMSSTAAIY
jgi:hypothetical protein